MSLTPISQKIFRKLNVAVTLFIVTFLTIGITATTVFAALTDTSEFQITINSGSLSAEIVDAGYVTVATPTVAMSAPTFGFACQTSGSTGTFGTSTEQIYIQNPDAADGGWTLTISANDGPTDFWDSAGTDMDFNDPTTSGCTDSGDADSLSGEMTVDATAATTTLAAGACSTCTIGNITEAASAAAFEEGVTDAITMLTAAAGSDDIGDWTLQDVGITQTIPGEQPAAADYTLDMRITVAAV